MAYIKSISHICLVAVIVSAVIFYQASYNNEDDVSSVKPSTSILCRDIRKDQPGFLDFNKAELHVADTQRYNTSDDFYDNSDVPCTFGLFRKYFKKHDYIPTGGDWVKMKSLDRYQPNICKYKYAITDDGFMARCFEKANLTHVVTTGDSNGGFNYNALVSALRELTCRPGRSDIGLVYPDRRYYTFYNESLDRFLQTRRRFCANVCASRETICKLSEASSTKTLLEQISSTMILDDSVQLALPDDIYYGDYMADMWALTNQEFYLRYFLKDRYPDLLIVTLPFNHDKNIALRRLELDIHHFTFLVKYYVPKTTKVFYIPSFSEFETPRKRSTWINKTFDGVLAAQKIDLMNHLLYRILADDIKDDLGRTHGFINLWEMSRSRESWSYDGVHMRPEWYDNTMSMFWETFCNSVNNDDF